MGFFEGPEKLMEVWWTPVLGADTRADLRRISRYFLLATEAQEAYSVACCSLDPVVRMF